jgi:hypothetical protein
MGFSVSRATDFDTDHVMVIVTTRGCLHPDAGGHRYS